jgi:hypothetical protein
VAIVELPAKRQLMQSRPEAVGGEVACALSSGWRAATLCGIVPQNNNKHATDILGTIR